MEAGGNGGVFGLTKIARREERQDGHAPGPILIGRFSLISAKAIAIIRRVVIIVGLRKVGCSVPRLGVGAVRGTRRRRLRAAPRTAIAGAARGRVLHLAQQRRVHCQVRDGSCLDLGPPLSFSLARRRLKSPSGMALLDLRLREREVLGGGRSRRASWVEVRRFTGTCDRPIA